MNSTNKPNDMNDIEIRKIIEGKETVEVGLKPDGDLTTMRLQSSLLGNIHNILKDGGMNSQQLEKSMKQIKELLES